MKPSTPQGNIRAALETLVKRLEQIHADPAYQGVWTIYQTHCGPYRGPQYADELQKAREALNVYEGPLPASPGTEHLPLEAAPSEKEPIVAFDTCGLCGCLIAGKNAAPQVTAGHDSSASANLTPRPPAVAARDRQFDKYGTPRTDAAEFTTYTEQIKVVEAEVARQLERELAIALGIIQTRKRYEAPSAKLFKDEEKK